MPVAILSRELDAVAARHFRRTPVVPTLRMHRSDRTAVLVCFHTSTARLWRTIAFERIIRRCLGVRLSHRRNDG